MKRKIAFLNFYNVTTIRTKERIEKDSIETAYIPEYVITFPAKVRLVDGERSHPCTVCKACAELRSECKIRSIYVTQVKTRERAF